MGAGQTQQRGVWWGVDSTEEPQYQYQQQQTATVRRRILRWPTENVTSRVNEALEASWSWNLEDDGSEDLESLSVSGQWCAALRFVDRDATTWRRGGGAAVGRRINCSTLGISDCLALRALQSLLLVYGGS
ncbi:hypothetical protein FQN50_008099 [Emmonsiellopsis sp. PD_5]|nr:hypothetical protein FQN50_008099 [Emmonsiellopsis sp. PD_5]